MSDSDLDTARGDAVQELAAALLMATGDILFRHGEDPTNHVIVAAGFVMAIRDIAKVDPRTPFIIREMLLRDPIT